MIKTVETACGNDDRQINTSRTTTVDDDEILFNVAVDNLIDVVYIASCSVITATFSY